MSNYLNNEYVIVKKYILDQFTEKGKESEIVIFHNQDNDISVIKTMSNGFNTYITLGAGAYEMNTKRKELKNTELVACSTGNITQEQEEFLVKSLCEYVPLTVNRNECLGEYHTMDWPQGKQHLFGYDFFMLLRAAEPLELKSKSVQFLILLPLYKQERDWIVTPGYMDLFLGKNKLDLAIAYGTLILEYCAAAYPSNEYFCIDGFREGADKSGNCSLDLFSPEKKTLFKTAPLAVPLYLQKGRRIGSSLWQDIRASLSQVKKTPTVKQQWKYEKTETEVTITGYIGQELKVVVPETIDGLPVTNISRDAFSPQKCLSPRIKETRSLLTEIIWPKTVDVILSDLSYCPCLERLVFSDNIKKIYSSCFHVASSFSSLHTSKYENGIYIGTEDNPYYALIQIENNAKHVILHERTNIIACGAFSRFMVQVEVLEFPAKLKRFDYKSLPTQAPYSVSFKIRAHKDSKAIRFAKKNNIDYEEI